MLPTKIPLPTLTLTLCLLCVTTAQATNKVSSPDITDGKTEFEYRGGYDYDDRDSRNAIDQHKFVVNHAFTGYWRTEVKADLVNNGHEDDWTFIEWSNRLQLNKDGSFWPKLSVQENYKFSLQGAKADKLEGTILLSKEFGDFTHVANVNFESEVGAHSTPGTDVNLGWKTKYHYLDYLDPGVEFYADFGKVIGPAPAGAKKYQIGPVIYGNITKSVKYEFGVLVGLSDSAPDGRIKGIVTYGF